jgi:hypothetical protein
MLLWMVVISVRPGFARTTGARTIAVPVPAA